MDSMEESLLFHLLRWELKEAWHVLKRDVELRHIVCVTAASIGLASFVCIAKSRVSSRRETARLAKLRKKKQLERENALHLLRQQLSNAKLSDEQVDEITSLPILELQAQLRSGKLKPSQALEAYQRKALKAHELTNCLVEPILEAQEMARMLDSTDSKDKLLYGIPVSIKDCFTIKGYDSTIGCSIFIDQKFERDAVIVQVLKEQGAIPFVKTNIPQTMMSWESTNPIFGPVCNPHDTTRSSGGSSGGEAALIAAGGSPLGIGSDIGGSLRNPAAECGIVALKLTSQRISGIGKNVILRGQRNVPGSNGPMAASVDGLILLMQALIGSPTMYELDPTLPIQPFNTEMLKESRQLKIGYYDFIQDMEVIPAISRTVHETKDILESLGYKVVPWNFLQGVAKELRVLFANSLFADGGKAFYDFLKHDATDDAIGALYSTLTLPSKVKKIIYSFGKLTNNAGYRSIGTFLGYKDGAHAWEQCQRIATLRQAVIEDWTRNELDAVISPLFGTVAVPHGTYHSITEFGGYMSTYNILDFVAGSLPVSRVSEADEAALSSYPSKVPDRAVYQTVRKAMKGSEGLPINVQVATLPFREELCLKIMKDIETAVKQRCKVQAGILLILSLYKVRIYGFLDFPTV